MLNEQGILQLADDLVLHAEHYDQSTFGVVTDCKTVCCMAGLCHVRAVGMMQFEVEATRLLALNFYDNCLTSGSDQLGLINSTDLTDLSDRGMIFGYVNFWPCDLQVLYRYSPVRAALMALERLQPDGSIGSERVRRLPQLELLDGPPVEVQKQAEEVTA
jgi:hypothetical protein